MTYGLNPDALGPLKILLEVKTRAKEGLSSIESLDKFPQYFLQCQLQMLCSDAEY